MKKLLIILLPFYGLSQAVTTTPAIFHGTGQSKKYIPNDSIKTVLRTSTTVGSNTTFMIRIAQYDTTLKENRVYYQDTLKISDLRFKEVYEDRSTTPSVYYNLYDYHFKVPENSFYYNLNLMFWSYRDNAWFANAFQITSPTGIFDDYINKPESKVVAIFDIQGRELKEAIPNTAIIVLFSDGRRRKIIVR